MAPLVQPAMQAGQSQLVLKPRRSRPWEDVYAAQPRLMETLRVFSRQGPRDMGLMRGVVGAEVCEARATAALWVMGERRVVPPPARVRGQALLSYDGRAAVHVEAVRRVLRL